MRKVSGIKKFVYVYIVVLVFFGALSIVLFIDANSLNGLYSFRQTNVNISGLCGQNVSKSVMIFYYANSLQCPSCAVEYQAFQNVTSLFGTGSVAEGTFLSPYFCAWDFNLTEYQENQTVNAPTGASSIFESLSDSRDPFVFLGGQYTQYYKIGGFSSLSLAEQDLLKYICLSINNIDTKVCSSV